jgi:hypothetical protein
VELWSGIAPSGKPKRYLCKQTPYLPTSLELQRNTISTSTSTLMCELSSAPERVAQLPPETAQRNFSSTSSFYKLMRKIPREVLNLSNPSQTIHKMTLPSPDLLPTSPCPYSFTVA